MAAVKQIPKEKIIDAATELVRRSGMSALNARTLANELGCSTRPIYLSFGGMDEVKSAVVENITRIYQGYLQREVQSGKYPPFKAYGMGYIRFAREEKEAFSYLFMRDRSNEAPVVDGGDYENVLTAVTGATGLDRESAKLFHFESWIFVHGIAAMAATSYAEFDEDTVQTLLTDMFTGLKTRFAQRGNK
ncbi:MAG: WHG domain-containing protein [Clostridia bacterium]|nr:WHG domain-containing protein [Clostridia bacterium]